MKRRCCTGVVVERGTGGRAHAARGKGLSGRRASSTLGSLVLAREQRRIQ
jgi:hypothetical protein